MKEQIDSLANGKETETGIDLLLGIIHSMLVSEEPPEMSALSESIRGGEGFMAVYEQLCGIRELSCGLSKGDLTSSVANRGYVIENLKAVQVNLRHLTGQSKRIAQGDYSQTLDYLGEVSEAFNDMTQKLAFAKERLIEQANLDALTGVSNRLALDHFLARAFAHAKARSGKLSVLIVDIDHFKEVNDKYTHLAGDEVLKVVSRRLQKQTRATDCFARYGGDEFVAVLVESDLDACKRVCERMMDAITATPIMLHGQASIPVTISIGASEIRPEDSRYEDVLLRSDTALYEAKQTGRNGFCFK